MSVRDYSQEKEKAWDSPNPNLQNTYGSDKGYSPNIDENQPIAVLQEAAFSFFRKSNQSSFIFNVSEKSTENIFSEFSNKYLLYVCLIVDNDSKDSSLDLSVTIDSFNKCASNIKELGFSYSNVLICCFIKEIKNQNTIDTLFPDYKEYEDIMQKNDAFICRKIQASIDSNEQIDILLSYKLQTTSVDILKNYYCNYIKSMTLESSLSENNSFIYSSVMKSGMVLNGNSLNKMMLTIENTKAICVVPAIESLPSDIFSNIQQYQLVHGNVYDLHYYNFASCVPSSSNMNMFKLNPNNLVSMQTFYTRLNIDASIEYHDHRLSLFLTDLRQTVFYAPDIEILFNQRALSFQSLMNNYCNQASPLFLTFPHLCLLMLSSCDCGLIAIFKKVALIFQLMGIFFDFTFVSFASMIIYTILVEGFGIRDDRAGAFFVIIYFFILILSCFNSFISSKNKPTSLLTFGLYILIEAYYLFIILCSVPAMHFVKLNTENDRYAFDTAAIVILILFNVIVGILPIAFNIKKIISNIKGMFMYFFLGSPCYTSMFLMQSIFISSDLYGTIENPRLKKNEEMIESRKGITIGLWGLTNLFFAFLIFFMVDRSGRVNCVLALSIIFTIYNIIKMVIIVVDTLIFTNPIEKLTNFNTNKEQLKEKHITRLTGLNKNYTASPVGVDKDLISSGNNRDNMQYDNENSNGNKDDKQDENKEYSFRSGEDYKKTKQPKVKSEEIDKISVNDDYNDNNEFE